MALALTRELYTQTTAFQCFRNDNTETKVACNKTPCDQKKHSALTNDYLNGEEG